MTDIIATLMAGFIHNGLTRTSETNRLIEAQALELAKLRKAMTETAKPEPTHRYVPRDYVHEKHVAEAAQMRADAEYDRAMALYRKTGDKRHLPMI